MWSLRYDIIQITEMWWDVLYKHLMDEYKLFKKDNIRKVLDQRSWFSWETLTSLTSDFCWKYKAGEEKKKKNIKQKTESRFLRGKLGINS